MNPSKIKDRSRLAESNAVIMSGPYGMQHLKNQYCSNCKRKKLEDRVYSSRERYNEVITEQLKDLKELEELLCPGGTLNSHVPDEVKTFHAEMKAL